MYILNLSNKQTNEKHHNTNYQLYLELHNQIFHHNIYNKNADIRHFSALHDMFKLLFVCRMYFAKHLQFIFITNQKVYVIYG